MTDALNSFWHFLRAHYRAGIAAGIAAQLVMGVFVFIDIHSYLVRHELSFLLALSHMPAVLGRSWVVVLLETFTLGIAIPVLGAIVLQAVSISPSTHRFISGQQRLMSCIHVILLASLAFFLVLAIAMQDIGGYAYE